MANKIIEISEKERSLLSKIRRRPPMFVGEYSLSKLRNFFDGYNYALDNQHCIIPKEFNEFVLKKYKIHPDNMSYVTAILQNMPDGKEAIEVFFNLLDEFLEVNGFKKIQ